MLYTQLRERGKMEKGYASATGAGDTGYLAAGLGDIASESGGQGSVAADMRSSCAKGKRVACPL